MIVRVFNLKFYSTVMVITLGIVSLLIGITNKLLLPLVLGVVFTFLGIYFLRKYILYKLILNPGSIDEIIGSQKSTTTFLKITKLDCKITKGIDSISIIPIFTFILESGEQEVLKLKDEASILTISEWVKQNYPEVEISESVKEVYSWKKYSPTFINLFFGSR